jgi:hypothetical protein
MAEPQHEPISHDSPGAPERPRLRAVGVVCDRCGHEESFEDARSGGWHVSRDGRHVICARCVELDALELDDVILYVPACGHAVEHGAVLQAQFVCAICEG